MSLFPLKRIAEEAGDRRLYLRGVELYNSGRVQMAEKEDFPPFAEFWTALVESDADPYLRYRVTVGFDRDGVLKHAECSCPAWQTRSGICKHIVALLVHKYYTDMTAALPAGRTVSTRFQDTRRPTDETARQMMARYLARGAAQQAAGMITGNDKVDLTPVLCLNGARPSLTLLVGTHRAYVVKDLLRFYADMQTGAVAEYGKQLQLVHRRESFSAASQPLLQLVLQKCEDLMTAAPGYGNARRSARELPLSPGAVDQLFALYAGQSILCRDSEKSGQHALMLRDGMPPLTAQVSFSKEKQGFQIICDTPRVLSGSRYQYIRQQDTLYRCSAEASEEVGDFLLAMEANGGTLFIAQADIGEFCTSVLPALRPYLRIEEQPAAAQPAPAGTLAEAVSDAAPEGTREDETNGTVAPASLLAAYMPLHPEAALYLDAPTPGVVTGRLVFRYGEQLLDPYALDTGNGQPDEPMPAPEMVLSAAQAGTLRRDKLAEMKVRLLVQAYFVRYLPEEGVLLLRGDDESLYRFITDGVSELAAVAALYATDRFKSIGVLPSPRVEVGVSLVSDLLDITFDVGGFDPEELAGVLESYRRHRRFHRLRSGNFVTLDETALAGFSQLAEGLSLTPQELRSGRVSTQKYRALYLDQVLRENRTMQFHRDGGFKSLITSMNAVADADDAVPASLDGVLRNYQKTGYRWLRTMERYGFGGILADDMGLGKTLQVIALLLAAREEGNDRPSLVVCPASLVLNWESEIHRFVPSLTVLTILGDADERAMRIRRLVGYDVAITSYDLLKRDIEHYAGGEFRYHIVDEAQYIKNHATQNAKAVKAIRSRQRFALTGTPVENRLSELWSIFDFLMPGFLYPYTRFRERIELPVIRAGDTAVLERLSRMTAPFILRRLKRDVLRELPPKTESVIYTDMTDEQRHLYAATALKARQELAESLARNRVEESKMAILTMLMRLRQLCCDPALCCEGYRGGSAKRDSCMELVREAVAGGHKVLLFSQFTSMLAILEEQLRQEGIAYYLLQGSTPKEARADMVEAFNRDETPVFLISLRAGGTGLNLTGADIVIHYDPWWNVAAQNQATDRAHRIGQRHSVQVYKLLARGTIEEKIQQLQERKQDLADAVVRTGDSLITSMTGEQLLELLQ